MARIILLTLTAVLAELASEFALSADKVESQLPLTVDLVVANGGLREDARARISDMAKEAAANNLDFIVHYPKQAPEDVVYAIFGTGAGIVMDESINDYEPVYILETAKYKQPKR